jgi:phospholipid-binding lipoprotein MlaA
MKNSLHLSFAAKTIANYAHWICAAVVFTLMTGCATGPSANPADPFERVNRGIYGFNDGVDRAVIRPVATAYRDAVPSLVRAGVNNFFGNLSDVWSLANNVMQLKVQNSAETFMRLNVNTFFGLGGLLDIASEANLPRHEEDFGLTLGHWGVPAGPYVMLPLLGPSTVRDAAALPVDRFGNPLSAIHDIGVRNSLEALHLVDKRSQYLRASQLIDAAALDRYSFTRDAFLQRRRSDARDGKGAGAEGGDD